MNRLINSAMMPRPGYYTLRRITLGQLVERLNREAFISYLGYPQNVEFLHQAGVTSPDLRLNRAETTVEDGDTLLILKLSYRVQGIKGAPVNPENFEFFEARFRASVIDSFTEAELDLLAEANNGGPGIGDEQPGMKRQMLVMNLADAIRLHPGIPGIPNSGYAEQMGVDGESLVARLSHLRPEALDLLVRAVELFWSDTSSRFAHLSEALAEVER